MLVVILSFVMAYFFAYNIGASGSAASMSVSYGSGVIKRKMIALLVCSLALFAGAIFGSGAVVKTLSKSIIPEKVITPEVVLIILISSAGTLFIANLLSIPLSTSEVTVGAIVGAGLAFQSLHAEKLLTIVFFWIAVPVSAMLVTYLLVKGGRFINIPKEVNPKWRRAGSILLILAGSLEAYAAGMNNVGNAIGPLVGAGLVPIKTGIFTGAIFMVLGVLSLGGRVIETSAKKIVKISVPNGIAISGVSGIMVTFASLYGLPIPITQVTTSAIAGVSAAKNGKEIWKQPIVFLIVRIWVVSPVLSMVTAYFLIQLCLRHNFYTTVVVLSVILATLFTASLAKTGSKQLKSDMKKREAL